MSLALWNGKDPILKERLFGLTNSEGDHGEDVKELYYYLDATPSHSYLKMLYKYPQAAFPYAWLVDENILRRRWAMLLMYLGGWSVMPRIPRTAKTIGTMCALVKAGWLENLWRSGNGNSDRHGPHR